MAKRKLKINPFDLIIVIFIIVLALIFGVSINNKPNLGSKVVDVEVKISNEDTINSILPKVKTSQVVYYSGTKYPVKQISYRIENNSSGQVKNLFIKLQGMGEIIDGQSIFNGQRIYLNQKVEIHSDYQVQGYVVNYYAD